MYIDKLIKKEIITLLVSVSLLVVIFIGVTYAKFLSVDNGSDTVINMGDLSIDFCNDSNCDSTYSNVGQVIGTKVENGVTVPAGIYPFKNDGSYSNETPYIFKVTNTGSLDSTVKIKLKEDASFIPTGDYSSYTRLTSKYADHLKVAISKRVLYEDTGYQLGDINLDGFVNKDDTDIPSKILTNNFTFTDEILQRKLADIDNNGVVSPQDSVLLMQTILGIDTNSYTKFYINNYTSLENGVIYDNDIIKAGEEAIYFVWLYLDSETPNDVQETYFAGNIDVVGEFIPGKLIYCTTDDALTDGLTYVHGDYTYTYNLSSEKWSIDLTDNTSTNPITSEICTYVNNKPITSMASLFSNSKATSIDLTNVNTINITTMAGMFSNSAATEIKFGKDFNTKNVKSFSGMFRNSSVISLDLSGFDTSSLTIIADMFNGSAATYIKFGNKFTASNVKSFTRMFNNSQVKTIDLSNFNTKSATNMGRMFAGSAATKIIFGENFDTSKVAIMSSMFADTKVESLDLRSFYTSNVTNMGSMFSGSTVKKIYVRGFTTSSVTNSTDMFTGCTNLIGGTGTIYDENIVDASYASIDAENYPGYFTYVSTFSSDSWSDVISTLKDNNVGEYQVGEIKEIDLGKYGVHRVRIANLSTPSECSTSGFSQSACGIVFEFIDNFDLENGFISYSSGNRDDINNIYNAFPSVIKDAIIDTDVVTSFGAQNSVSTEKLYLLSPIEIYSDYDPPYLDVLKGYKDASVNLSRTLDYYKYNGVTTTSYKEAIKYYNSKPNAWSTRTGYILNGMYMYEIVDEKGSLNTGNVSITNVSLAFRIG